LLFTDASWVVKAEAFDLTQNGGFYLFTDDIRMHSVIL